jgi:hypothetical protein
MRWENLSKDPKILSHYELFKDSGVLDYIEETRDMNKALEELLQEAKEIFRQESVDELIELIIHYLAEKFIPSNMVFILNEGIMVNKIKTIICRNM